MTKKATKPKADIKAVADTGQEEKTLFKRIDADDPHIKYDHKMIADFIDMVFHGIAPDDTESNVLLWKTSTGVPGYPSSEEKMAKILKSSRKAGALYFGTSSCSLDPETKGLRNRKSLFRQLHVVVLDDIGTKVSVDKIPLDLKPTYIIESSAGNYQYGYVLKKPVTVLEHAEALIQVVYETGLSDAGGKMPTKLVRLPDGINGKQGEKRTFRVNLKATDGPLWDIEDLLETMDAGVTWADIERDAADVIKRRSSRTVGTSPWSPTTAVAPALDGIVDPVLEWLYTEDMVAQDTDQWTTIKCPWEDGHSSGDGTAGYSALGKGEGHERFRGFHCFHDNCKDKTISDFLQYVATNHGPEAAIHDQAAELVATWAYDSSSDMVWQVRGLNQPRPIAMAAFKNTFPQKATVRLADGKLKSVPETSIWMNAKNRVVVQGRTFDPTTTAKIATNGQDKLINMFYQPDWGKGDYLDADVEMFTQFLEYLVPIEEEREYFMEWLAAKVQNMGFRGAAILMIAKQQGTGRSTLADMLKEMMGSCNVENVPFHKLAGDQTYNEWMEKPLVITNETKDTPDGKGFFKAYEGMKDFIDPRPIEMRINPKYGTHRMSTVYSSYLMFSNHDNAIGIAGNDRRFYVIMNALRPESPEFFTKLNKWLEVKEPDGTPRWARSVCRWLQEREVNIEKLLAPAPNTAAKEAMVAASKNHLQVAVEAILNNWGGDFVAVFKIRAILNSFANRLAIDVIPNFDAQLRSILSQHTESLPKGVRLNIDKHMVRPRVMLHALSKPGYMERYMRMGKLDRAGNAAVRESITSVNSDDIKAKVNEALDLIDAG